MSAPETWTFNCNLALAVTVFSDGSLQQKSNLELKLGFKDTHISCMTPEARKSQQQGCKPVHCWFISHSRQLFSFQWTKSFYF